MAYSNRIEGQGNPKSVYKTFLVKRKNKAKGGKNGQEFNLSKVLQMEFVVKLIEDKFKKLDNHFIVIYDSDRCIMIYKVTIIIRGS